MCACVCVCVYMFASSSDRLTHYSYTMKNLVRQTSKLEYEERILGILEAVGSGGFLLLEPDCALILEGKSSSAICVWFHMLPW